MSKCKFTVQKVAYLGHVISAEEEKADLDKLTAITEWPFPTSLKSLREFLGLIGYYRRFIKDYGSIVAPLN